MLNRRVVEVGGGWYSLGKLGDVWGSCRGVKGDVLPGEDLMYRGDGRLGWTKVALVDEEEW